MSVFHWNPIKRNLTAVSNSSQLSKSLIEFVPRNYVRQRKRKLYNNLLVLLGGLWALTVSHDMDTSDIEARFKIKNIVETSGLFVGHLVAVPLIIGKLNLHYSIMLGAMGMSVTPFFYYVTNPIGLSVAIGLRCIFVALFDVSAMTYIVRLARVCSRIQGNELFKEILTVRSVSAMFGGTANVVSSAWRRYIKQSEETEEADVCGSNYCPGSSTRRLRLAVAFSFGQNTIFIAVTIIVALSGTILIAMYSKPLTNLGDSELLNEPRVSNPFRLLKQIARPKAKQVAVLITSCIFMGGLTQDFARAYITCLISNKYSFSVITMKEFSIMFGAMSCLTIVDFTGFYWLYGFSLVFQMLAFLSLVLWDSSLLTSLFSNLIVYHVLCICFSVEISILQLLLIQTLGDEEVSAWCLYFVLTDVVLAMRTIAESYICVDIELWIAIALSPVAIAAVVTISRGFSEGLKKINLNERCSLVVRTPKKTIAKQPAYDLNIIVESVQDIRRVETFLERKYTLASRSLVPPPDDVVFPEALSSLEDLGDEFF